MEKNTTGYLLLLTGAALLALIAVLSMLTEVEDEAGLDLSADSIVAASQGAFGDQFPPALDIEILEAAAAAGDPVAQNNLAVILLRSRTSGARARADQLLEDAASQGLIQARYNIAHLIPHRFNTDPALVARQIDLLRQNAEAGDPHSMALLAARLRFVNRDAYVEDRLAYQLSLLETAARTGDPDYMLQYGAEMWDRIRNLHPDDHGPERAAEMRRIADVLLAVHDTGEPRAAVLLAEMLRERNVHVLAAHLNALGHPTTRLEWLDRAALAGMGYAQCHFARTVLTSVSEQDLQTADPVQIRTGIITNALPFRDRVIQQALDHAASCATPPARAPDASRAFGEDALYRAKFRGTWPAMLDSRAEADILLGVMAALGIFARPDPVVARFHMLRASDMHDRADGLAFLARLDGTAQTNP